MGPFWKLGPFPAFLHLVQMSPCNLFPGPVHVLKRLPKICIQAALWGSQIHVNF